MLVIMMSNMSVITVLYAKKRSLISPEISFSKACPSQWEDNRFVITDLFYVKKEIYFIVVLKKGNYMRYEEFKKFSETSLYIHFTSP